MPEETRETQPDLNENDFLRVRAVVLPVAERAKAASSDAELLAIAKAQAADPSIFDEFPPAFFTAAVSTNQLDSYYTRMHKTSLQNFAEDLNTGVSLQDSHNTYERGLGYSLRGRYIGAGGNGVQRTLGDFYSVPSDPRKVAFVNDLRSASVRDVSVGFHLGEQGRYVCDLCGMDIGRDYHEHWPGVTYDINGNAKRATWTIHDARLSEVSAVFDGSTPGAVILKAQRAAEAGNLTPEIARLLETQYRINLSAAHHCWAGADLRSQKEADMPENDTRAPEPGADWTLPAAERERYRTLVSECGLKPDAPPAAAIEAMRSQLASRETERDTAVTERDELKVKVADLEPRAKEGDQYRTDLVNQTWGEYNRAGKAVGKDEEATKARWRKEPLDELKERLAEYTESGDTRFPGGRLTGEGEQPTPAGTPAPLHLYAV